MNSTNPIFKGKSLFNLIKTAAIYKASQANFILKYGAPLTELSYKITGKGITNCLIENTGGQIFTSGPTIQTLLDDADQLYQKYGIGSVANFVLEGIENDDIQKFDGAKDFLIETMEVSK